MHLQVDRAGSYMTLKPQGTAGPKISRQNICGI